MKRKNSSAAFQDDELVQHGNAETRREAAQIAIESGVHMDMQSLIYYEHLNDLNSIRLTMNMSLKRFTSI